MTVSTSWRYSELRSTSVKREKASCPNHPLLLGGYVPTHMEMTAKPNRVEIRFHFFGQSRIKGNRK